MQGTNPKTETERVKKMVNNRNYSIVKNIALGLRHKIIYKQGLETLLRLIFRLKMSRTIQLVLSAVQMLASMVVRRSARHMGK